MGTAGMAGGGAPTMDIMLGALAACMLLEREMLPLARVLVPPVLAVPAVLAVASDLADLADFVVPERESPAGVGVAAPPAAEAALRAVTVLVVLRAVPLDLPDDERFTPGRF